MIHQFHYHSIKKNNINTQDTCIHVQIPSLSQEVFVQVPANESFESSDQTPKQLVEYFEKLDNMKIESLDLLVSYIHDISISCGCQFVSKQTGLSRSTQIFASHFHNTIYKCNACVKFI